MCLQVINQMKANWYKITSADMKLNMARMNAPYNINDPFETIID